VLESTGAFELRYGTVNSSLHPCLVGFTLGNGAPDPGSVDLSTSLPFSTGSGGTPASLAAAAGSRPAVGRPFTMGAGGVPAGSQFGFMVLSGGAANPSLELGALGMPGCFQHVDLGTAVALLLATSPLPVQFPLVIPNNAGLIGTSVFAQAALHSPGFNGLDLIASNG